MAVSDVSDFEIEVGVALPWIPKFYVPSRAAVSFQKALFVISVFVWYAVQIQFRLTATKIFPVAICSLQLQLFH